MSSASSGIKTFTHITKREGQTQTRIATGEIPSDGNVAAVIQRFGSHFCIHLLLKDQLSLSKYYSYDQEPQPAVCKDIHEALQAFGF